MTLSSFARTPLTGADLASSEEDMSTRLKSTSNLRYKIKEWSCDRDVGWLVHTDVEVDHW